MSPNRRSLKFYQADVFTDLPFGGNPVAVFPDAVGLSDGELRHIAREMNLSETVFVFPPSNQATVARLRIFTPLKEIPFAGHPVLGTFFVLGTLGLLPLKEPLTVLWHECAIGMFPVEIHVHHREIFKVVMSQPKPEFLGKVESVGELHEVAQALGLARNHLLDVKYPVEVVSTGLPVMIVPIRALTAVRSIVPNVMMINDLCARFGANGIMVFTTVTVEELSTVHTRFFCPSLGVLEDPATGSASGALGCYLVQNGAVEVGPTTSIVAEQGYEIDRPSRIRIDIESEDDAIQEVKVGGQVVMIAEGTLTF